MNFSDIESSASRWRACSPSWKRGETRPDGRDALDHVHRDLDAVDRDRVARPSRRSPDAPRAGHVRRRRRRVRPRTQCGAGARSDAGDPSLPPARASSRPCAARRVSSRPSAATETVRIAVAKLDARLLEAEEMLAAKLAASQRAADLGALAGAVRAVAQGVGESRSRRRAPCARRSSGRTRRRRADVSPLVDSSTGTTTTSASLESKVAALAAHARSRIARWSASSWTTARELQEAADAAARDARRAASASWCATCRRDQGKEADLVIRGEEVEIDKRILEEMKDPLIHLLRNCDRPRHRDARRAARGRASRRAPRSRSRSRQSNGNKVEIRVSDDGAGIDVEQVKARRGQARADRAAEAADTDDEATALGARSSSPDVSTSPIITESPAAGWAWRSCARRPRSSAAASSSRRGRARARRSGMMLPLTLATFRGILVEAAAQVFVVPTAQVERVVRVRRGRRPDRRGPRDAVARRPGRRAGAARRRAGTAACADARGDATRPLPVLILGVGRAAQSPSPWTPCSTSRKCWSSGSASRCRACAISPAPRCSAPGEVAPDPERRRPAQVRAQTAGARRRAESPRRRSRPQATRASRSWSPKIRSPRACCSRASSNPPATA